jgi:hypothetical protein
MRRVSKRFEAAAFRLPQRAQRQTPAEHMAEGRHLLETLAACGRKMLAALMEGSIIDGVILNNENVVTDTTSFPLFPVAPEPDAEMLEMLKRLEEWTARFTEWLDAQML